MRQDHVQINIEVTVQRVYDLPDLAAVVTATALDDRGRLNYFGTCGVRDANNLGEVREAMARAVHVLVLNSGLTEGL